MKTMRRRICWLAVCVFVAAIAAVPLLALVNGRWASEAALGDVVISYAGFVRFYDNATGDEKETHGIFSVPGEQLRHRFRRRVEPLRHEQEREHVQRSENQ